jgi:hypothetical protein
VEGKRHSPRAILWRREGREADRRGEGEGPTVAGGGALELPLMTWILGGR